MQSIRAGLPASEPRSGPCIYGDDMRFEIGKGIRVREGSDVAIITTGTLLHNAIQAAAILEPRASGQRWWTCIR